MTRSTAFVAAMFLASVSPAAWGSPAKADIPGKAGADSGGTPSDKAGTDTGGASSDAGGSEISHGSGVFLTPPVQTRPAAGPSKGDVTLSFVGVGVQDVAKAILGDMLGLSYTVDPSAQGTVSVETTAPVRRDQVLAIFETSLEAAKLALVQNGNIYTIVPLAAAQRRGTLLGASDAGYGSEAVPLHYVGAADLKKILDPLVPDSSITQVDASRNVIFIAGSESQRLGIRNLIKQFDVNWLKGMSFGLFIPKWSDSQNLATQLTQVLGGEGMPTAGLVRIVPIQQVNGILVISPQPDYVERARKMIDSLDREGERSQPRLFVYHVQNGRAADLAAVLSASFGAGDQSADTQPAAGGLSGANRQSPAASSALSGASRPQAGSAAPSMADTRGGQAQVSGQTLQLGGNGQSVTIAADETNNAIIVRAVPSQYETIADALRKLDVQPLQVMIEAAITEVTLTSEMNYGVQWFFQKGQNTFSLTQSKTVPQPLPNYPGFSYLLSNGSDIMTMLNALSDVTKVNVLSSPRLFVLNNHTATLQVGDQVPVSTQSAIGIETANAPVVNSIEYRDTGVILKVTPRVNDSGLVLLDIAQEVSDVSTTSTSNIDSPTIQQRRVASSVAVQDGRTIALGGLITDRKSRAKTGIPYLNDIPILGNLLGDTDDVHNRTELLIMLTPHVVRNAEDASIMTDAISRTIHGIEPLPAAKDK